MGKPETSKTERILVIGYGSSIRSDDAVGLLAAEEVASWAIPGVSALAVHQLTPELAAPLASAHLAIFVDAQGADSDDEVEVATILSQENPKSMAHTGDPRALLALTLSTFGVCPDARLITVPVSDFSIGQGLSPTALRGLRTALGLIENLLQAGSAASTPTSA